MNIKQIIFAYQNGYFPMPDPDSGEILWLQPDPRAIIPLGGFHVSRRLARRKSQTGWQVSFNQDFGGVMAGCRDRPDTWITDEFVEAYTQLHRLGVAHSVEVYWDGTLAGGTYGVSLGGAFFAESKFHRMTDASKIALWALVERMKEQEMLLLEVQFLTEHLRSLGAVTIPRDEYAARLKEALKAPVQFSRSSERGALFRPSPGLVSGQS
jgi:leucyl/phenylalanyl-tRNA--protein transferase